MAKTKFDNDHMKRLEAALFGPESSGGLMGEDVADILDTFNWAYHEGDAMICCSGFKEKDKFVDSVKMICEKFNVYYRIFETKDGTYLEL